MKIRFTPISARYLSVNDKIDGYMASRLNADARCYSYDAFLFYILLVRHDPQGIYLVIYYNCNHRITRYIHSYTLTQTAFIS